MCDIPICVDDVYNFVSRRGRKEGTGRKGLCGGERRRRTVGPVAHVKRGVCVPVISRADDGNRIGNQQTDQQQQFHIGLCTVVQHLSRRLDLVRVCHTHKFIHVCSVSKRLPHFCFVSVCCCAWERRASFPIFLVLNVKLTKRKDKKKKKRNK
jgi:hypothetical protein